MFRANTRNAVELEKFLRRKGAAALKAQGQAIPVIDPSDPDEYDRHMIEQHGPPPQYTAAPQTNQGAARPSGQVQLAQPPQVRLPAQRQGGGSWFGFGGKGKQADVESGDMLQSAQPLPNSSTLQKNRPGY
jgi:hypothetical protein